MVLVPPGEGGPQLTFAHPLVFFFMVRQDPLMCQRDPINL